MLFQDILKIINLSLDWKRIISNLLRYKEKMDTFKNENYKRYLFECIERN